MDEVADYRPQWEHHIEYVPARGYDPKLQDFLAQYYRSQKVPHYAVQAIIPRLNELGEHGWELMHIQPVIVGEQGDVNIEGINRDTFTWANTYLCVFKHLKRSDQL